MPAFVGKILWATTRRKRRRSRFALHSGKVSEDAQTMEVMTVDKLKELLRLKGLKVSGRKQELIERLQAYEAEHKEPLATAKASSEEENAPRAEDQPADPESTTGAVEGESEAAAEMLTSSQPKIEGDKEGEKDVAEVNEEKADGKEEKEQEETKPVDEHKESDEKLEAKEQKPFGSEEAQSSPDKQEEKEEERSEKAEAEVENDGKKTAEESQGAEQEGEGEAPKQDRLMLESAGLLLNVELYDPTTMRLCFVTDELEESKEKLPAGVWKFLTTMDGLSLGKRKTEWRFPREQLALILDKVQSGLPGVSVLATPTWAWKAMEAKKVHESAWKEAEAGLQEYLNAAPAELLANRPLMEFQKEGIKFGIALQGRCLIADEMGLGKTLQALVIISHYVQEWPAIIVVPPMLRLAWKEQVLSWLPHLVKEEDVQVLLKGGLQVDPAAQIVIVGYELLVLNKDYQVHAGGKRYKVAVIDESHYIKNPDAKRTEAVRSVVEQTTRCVMISGTPIVNKSAEIHTQIRALLPKHVPKLSTFAQRYSYKRTVLMRWSKWPKTEYFGARNQNELNTLLKSTIMIRRLKKDVLTELSPKITRKIILDPQKLDPAKMQEAAELLQQAATEAKVKVDELLGKVRQVTHTMMTAFAKTAEAKIGGVQDYVEILLSSDVKFVIFAHHKTMLDGIEDTLVAQGVKYIRIDGDTPVPNRKQEVDLFQHDEEVRVAVLSITACGQGIALTAAHTVVFAELYWSPGQMVQAEDRVHRIGQNEKVDVHYCIAEGTVDNGMLHMLNRKTKYTTAILNGEIEDLNANNKASSS